MRTNIRINSLPFDEPHKLAMFEKENDRDYGKSGFSVLFSKFRIMNHTKTV